MNIINFNNKKYPYHQCIGNASQFAIPYAKHYCQGVGYDIGCMKKEWSYPGSIPIDISFNDEYDANNLPQNNVDYIYSSHCLEHIPLWVPTLNYWYETLKPGGILFLYLPHYSQEYWRPWNNSKHVNILTPEYIKDWMTHKGFTNIFIGEKDLNDSFMIVGEKNKVSKKGNRNG
jgi:predicted SAM-dependent methyltransferase